MYVGVTCQRGRGCILAFWCHTTTLWSGAARTSIQLQLRANASSISVYKPKGGGYLVYRYDDKGLVDLPYSQFSISFRVSDARLQGRSTRWIGHASALRGYVDRVPGIHVCACNKRDGSGNEGSGEDEPPATVMGRRRDWNKQAMDRMHVQPGGAPAAVLGRPSKGERIAHACSNIKYDVGA